MNRSFPTQLLSLLLCTSLTLAPVYAHELPDLGDPSAAELSPLAENRLGETIMRQLRQRDPSYLDDAEVNDYLNRLGNRLVEASPNPGQRFEFFALQDSSLNAFALPGGFIGVHTGLLLASQSESELASVLGHEIAHVTQRHIARKFATSSQSNMLMLASVVLAVLAARSNPQVSQAALTGGMAGTIQSQLGYSRDFEREADRIGFQILDKAGFDVRGMPAFFDRLQKNGRFYDSSAPAYLRTHPMSGERMSDMSNRVQDRPYRQIADSLDFVLVRAKLKAMNDVPREALLTAQRQLAQAQGSARIPAHYTLARAALRNRNTALAREQLVALHRLKVSSPFIDLLASDIAQADNQHEQAIQILREARQRHPELTAILYALLDSQLQAGRHREAATLAEQALRQRPGDGRLWQMRARAHAYLGQRSEEHRAQGEVYLLQGSYGAALQQFELAQKAGDGDFFLQSTIDARLREARRLRDEELREAREKRG